MDANYSMVNNYGVINSVVRMESKGQREEAPNVINVTTVRSTEHQVSASPTLYGVCRRVDVYTECLEA